jgi:hypothetical protein
MTVATQTAAFAGGSAEQGGPSGLESLPTSDSLKGTSGKVLHRLEIVSSGASKAQLLVRFMDSDADERGGPGAIAVIIGKQSTLVPAVRRPGRIFPIPASDTVLQHWRLDGKDMLIYVRPNDEISFMADACAVWTLSSDRLNPNLNPGAVVCQPANQPCAPGWQALADPPLPGDRRCTQAGNALRLCARTGKVVLRAERQTSVDLGVVGEEKGQRRRVGPNGQPIEYEAVFERCSIPSLKVGGRRTLLLIGFGETWSLVVAKNGGVSGTAGL